MLRGNDECAAITWIYGFYDGCKRRYNKIWKHCVDAFNGLPLCAVIDDKIFCLHGGLSPEMQTLDQVKSIGGPLDVPDCGLMCDFLWADPESEINGWEDNDRGVSYTFGPDTVEGFLKKIDFDVAVRALFAGRRFITLFSAPNYCGEFDNSGAMMTVDSKLMISFQVLKLVKGKR
ncbi:unnamed protein product [Prorocentrum cordatum]|uniref:protein-serine/threonine phosphatase n=1 Tax=Prorocentrum cordatum TaxID=2364126 RepID=A0ABN9QZ47_9DINO|nr:unnamed protein product [Polarella glacialis]